MRRTMNVIREHLRKLLFFIILTLGTTAVWGQPVEITTAEEVASGNERLYLIPTTYPSSVR